MGPGRKQRGELTPCVLQLWALGQRTCADQRTHERPALRCNSGIQRRSAFSICSCDCCPATLAARLRHVLQQYLFQ